MSFSVTLPDKIYRFLDFSRWDFCYTKISEIIKHETLHETQRSVVHCMRLVFMQTARSTSCNTSSAICQCWFCFASYWIIFRWTNFKLVHSKHFIPQFKSLPIANNYTVPWLLNKFLVESLFTRMRNWDEFVCLFGFFFLHGSRK